MSVIPESIKYNPENEVVTNSFVQMKNPQAILIQPYNLVETKTYVITSFIPEVISIKFNTSVTVLVTLFNEMNIAVGNKTLIIDGAEYKNWMNDDNYLIDLVANKIGFTKA